MIKNLTVGGTPKHLLSLISHFDRTRVQPTLCLLDGDSDISRALEPANVPVHRLGVQKIRSIRGVNAIAKLVRTLKREGIQIIQPYYPDSTYLGVAAAHLAGVPVVLRTRNNNNYWMNFKERHFGRLLNPFLTATVCNCLAGRMAVLQDERPDPESVVVIENGIDLNRFQAGPPIVSRVGRRVGMVTSLRTIKGYDLFLQAAARLSESHPDVTFHLVGAGNAKHRARLTSMVEELGLEEKLEYHGPISEVPAFLTTLDLAVLSSRAEGMPNAIMEYMAMRLPIVATNVGGVPELIRDGLDGLLVPVDSMALATGMARLLDQPDLAKRLAYSAHQRIDSSFSMHLTAQRWAGWYESLLESSRQGSKQVPQPPPVVRSNNRSME